MTNGSFPFNIVNQCAERWRTVQRWILSYRKFIKKVGNIEIDRDKSLKNWNQASHSSEYVPNIAPENTILLTRYYRLHNQTKEREQGKDNDGKTTDIKTKSQNQSEAKQPKIKTSFYV